MIKPKVFILLPDGIGLRNFAFTNFHQIGIDKDNEVFYWNQTEFPIQKSLDFKEIKIESQKMHPLTQLYSRARTHIELALWERKFNDKIYKSYIFHQNYKGIKNFIKSCFVDFLKVTNTSDKGLSNLKKKIKKIERRTLKYQLCKEQLEVYQPQIVFSTNQRPTQGISAILAAQDMGIPTATFIFSWDNLPKATMVLETDYYFVWSAYMKEELKKYYRNIQDNKIFVTGSPQFEPHFEHKNIIDRTEFFKMYNLDPEKKYISFSGDDVTSSPDDPKYLEDVSKAIQELNTEGHNLGIIFRRCPVDFSGRYNPIIDNFSDVITPIDPEWKPLGESWNQIFPLADDWKLLSSIAAHCEVVVNIGSSMVFDFVAHKKPCIYLAYNQVNQLNKKWNVHTCYKYVHFRSIPQQPPVFWIKNKLEIKTRILEALIKPELIVEAAQTWFQTINQHPPHKASERIWEGIDKIIDERS